MMTIIKYVRSASETWDGTNVLILPDMLEEKLFLYGAVIYKVKEERNGVPLKIISVHVATFILLCCFCEI